MLSKSFGARFTLRETRIRTLWRANRKQIVVIQSSSQAVSGRIRVEEDSYATTYNKVDATLKITVVKSVFPATI